MFAYEEAKIDQLEIFIAHCVLQEDLSINFDPTFRQTMMEAKVQQINLNILAKKINSIFISKLEKFVKKQ